MFFGLKPVPAKTRQLHLDLLKITGSQFIVLHHFSAYGPLAEAVYPLAPKLMEWMYEYARMAVQIFLVMGGYLAVQNLMPVAQQSRRVLAKAVLQRYRRLVLPFLAALILSVICAALARYAIDDDFIPQAPTLKQALAHALMLQGVTQTEALSAGVWYVAIDFQLFVLLAVVLWVGHRLGRRRTAQALVLGLMLASLWLFNLNAQLDNYAIYFFGSYGLGVLAFWASRSRRPGNWLILGAAAGTLALFINFRERIALALLTALLLCALQMRGARLPLERHLPDAARHKIHQWGQASYALFLVHFPVLMLGNAAFEAWLHPQQALMALGLQGQTVALTGYVALMLLAVCWGLSMLIADVFERWVEAPLNRWGYRHQRNA